MKSGKRPIRREGGASLVEFAIVLPLFLLLIGGMIDFGRAYFTQVMLTNAAREGARAAMYGTPPHDRAAAAAAGVTKLTISEATCPKGATTGSVTVTVQTQFAWTLLAPIMDPVNAHPTLTGRATMQCGG